MTVQVPDLGKANLAALRAQARTLGISPQAYAAQLIECGLSLEREARTRTFDEMYGPAQERFRKSRASESGLDQLVNQSLSRQRRRASRKKA